MVGVDDRERIDGRGPAALLILGSCLTAMAGTAITPALPAIRAAFPGPGSDLLSQFVLTVTAAFTALSAPLVGLTIDRAGVRPVLVAGAVAFALAGASGFLARTLFELLAGRALLGIGVAAVSTSMLVVVARAWDGPRRTTMLGVQAAATSLGGMVLLLAGGHLAETGWRYVFLPYLAGLGLLPFLLRPMAHVAGPPPETGAIEGGRLAFACVALFLAVSAF